MKQRCLVVLGTHRSGTSAVAGSLALLGVDFGESLLPPSPDNPKGYWEHSAVVDVHQRLLEALGTEWYRPMPAGEWWSAWEVAPFRDELIDIVTSGFGDSLLWGLKDPRMCRLVPLWEQILSAVDVEARYLLVERHPAAVAASLGRRDGFSEIASHLLWLEHTLAAEGETRQEVRSVVEYDDLMEDPSGELRRIGAELGLEWPRGPREVVEQLERFLTPDLRHHRVADDGAEDLPSWVESAWRHRPRAGVAMRPVEGAALTRARRSLEAALSYLRPLTELQERDLAGHKQHAGNLESEVERLRNDLAGHQKHAETRDSEIESLRTELDEFRTHASTLERSRDLVKLELDEYRAHASNLERSREEVKRELDALREKHAGVERAERRWRRHSDELRKDRDALDRRQARDFAALAELKRTSRREASAADTREKERDLFIEEQARLLEERDEQVAHGLHVVADREQKIAGLETALEYLHEEMAHRHEEIAHREKEIAHRDGEIARRDREIALRDVEIARRDDEIIDRDGRISDRDDEIARLEGDLLAIRTSRSWRLTRPLRWLFSLAGESPSAPEAGGRPSVAEPEDRSD